MLRLFIDDVYCPLTDEKVSLPRYSAACLRGIEGWREGSKMCVGVRSTYETDRLMCFAADIYHGIKFNDTYHKAVVEVDGSIVYEGVVTLDEVEYHDEGNIYRLTIRSGGAEWADKAVLTRLNKTSLSDSRMMTLSDIEKSWSDSGIVRFLPVRRDSYPKDAYTGIYVAQKTMMPHDYYPFISIQALLRAITTTNGYRVVSNFLNTDIVSRLMMSGAYRSVDSASAFATMGFKAMRSKSNTAAAGEDGRVYAWEPVMASNVGAVVDTVDPSTLGEDDRPMFGAYSTGECFTFDEGRPIFTPVREISVAFDVHLHYLTDYKVASSQRLKGFDTIHLGNGCDVNIDLSNTYTNLRHGSVAGRTLKLFIFDYTPGKIYYLSGHGTVTEQYKTVTISSGMDVAPDLFVRDSVDDPYSLYRGDWALYESYVLPEGSREVEITVRTPFERLSPTSPKRFNDIYFGGGDEGQELTLLSGCSITPVFGGAVGYGERVDFEDVSNVDIAQSSLLEAIAHMFNLCVYTHRPSRCLYMEPYDDFFSGPEIDWRSRQMMSGAKLSDDVADSFEHTTIGYQPADGVASRAMSTDTFGCWSKHVDSYGAKHGVDVRTNPLFMPTVSLSGATSTAPSAEVLTVGDRDAVTGGDELEPRVVLYHGVKTLPEGEVWPSPSGSQSYPFAAFHSTEADDTLCFENRDGQEGLHRYYDRELAERAERGKLTCGIFIQPSEYAKLFDPGHNGANIRSIFRLNVGGHSSLFRLDSIERYDTDTYVATCTFQRMLND